MRITLGHRKGMMPHEGFELLQRDVAALGEPALERVAQRVERDALFPGFVDGYESALHRSQVIIRQK